MVCNSSEFTYANYNKNSILKQDLGKDVRQALFRAVAGGAIIDLPIGMKMQMV